MVIIIYFLIYVKLSLNWLVMILVIYNIYDFRIFLIIF